MNEEEEFLRILLHAMRIGGKDCHEVNLQVIKSRLNKVGTQQSPMFPAMESEAWYEPYSVLFRKYGG